jgi:hypothetical protein
MGIVNVYFQGICTHMQWPEAAERGEVPGFRHRVVLVNGRKPREINQKPIGPHVAMLSIAARDLAGGAGTAALDHPLDGRRVTIVNATGPALTYDPSYECCIPHLSALANQPVSPSVPVVVGADAQHASCYFDVEHGLMRAGTIPGQAVATQLIAPTDGDPRLRIEYFRSHEWLELTLRDGAQVVVSNAGIDEASDDQYDFLLHYLTAEQLPANPGVPTSTTHCRSTIDLPPNVGPKQNIGPGCSNSNFP